MRKPTTSREATHDCERWQFDPAWPAKEKPAGLERCRACGSVRVANVAIRRPLHAHRLDDFVDLVPPADAQHMGVYVLHLHPLDGWIREFQDDHRVPLTLRQPRPARVG